MSNTLLYHKGKIVGGGGSSLKTMTYTEWNQLTDEQKSALGDVLVTDYPEGEIGFVDKTELTHLENTVNHKMGYSYEYGNITYKNCTNTGSPWIVKAGSVCWAMFYGKLSTACNAYSSLLVGKVPNGYYSANSNLHAGVGKIDNSSGTYFFRVTDNGDIYVDARDVALKVGDVLIGTMIWVVENDSVLR